MEQQQRQELQDHHGAAGAAGAVLAMASKGTRKGGSRSRSRRSGGSSRSKGTSKGKGSSSMRQTTYWAQNAGTKELQDAINEAARELALRADAD